MLRSGESPGRGVVGFNLDIENRCKRGEWNSLEDYVAMW